MPMYDFLCENADCGNLQEDVHESMAEHRDTRPCPACGGVARTVLHVPGVLVDGNPMDYDLRHAVRGEYADSGMTAKQHETMYKKSVEASRKRAVQARRKMGKRHDVGIRRIGTIPLGLHRMRQRQTNDPRYWETDTKKKLSREGLFFGD